MGNGPKSWISRAIVRRATDRARSIVPGERFETIFTSTPLAVNRSVRN
jgi:hypothetical protein